MPPPGLLLSGGERFGSLETIHLPGHSPGSVGFLDRAAGVLFSGDTLFRGGLGRTDLKGGDARLLAESLEKLFALEGNTRVCPGHGEETTIARETALGSYFV
jgi:glyoxylase-like metal-dependent hydrolase (beta-lactamase superfamily II)